VGDLDLRKLAAECLGTALLVFFAVGVATLSFGFKAAGSSPSAGVVATALAFGLVLMALVYTIGGISGAHVNPAVTIGFLTSGRMKLDEAVGYWVAQVVGGILGALVLFGVVSQSPGYDRGVQGLGDDGYGHLSMIGLNTGGAFLAEVVLTFLFVLVVLAATSRLGNPDLAGVAIGVALTTVHLVGVPLTGTSVNPARSIGPALFQGGDALSQIWLFIVAPLVGGAIAAFAYRFFAAGSEDRPGTAAPSETRDDLGGTATT